MAITYWPRLLLDRCWSFQFNVNEETKTVKKNNNPGKNSTFTGNSDNKIKLGYISM